MLDWFLNVSQDDDVTTTTKPKRRFLRFSLRTLLLFMLVVCVAVGWKFERVRKQREAVAWVHEMGGTVYYDFEFGGGFSVELAAEPRGPEWLRKWLGRDFFDDVAYVDLRGTQVSDVTALAKLTKLKRLNLSNTQVSDVTPLAKLTLTWLYLDRTQVSEQAIDQLKRALPQCVIRSGRTNQ